MAKPLPFAKGPNIPSGPEAEPVAPDQVRAAARPIIDWLLTEERPLAARTTLLLDRFARRLIEIGLPVDRMTLHIPQLHPQLAGRSLVWEAEAGGAIEVGYEHSVRNRAAYLASPVRLIYDEGSQGVRRCLARPECPRDFPILDDLAARGFTDYAIYPMLFTGGRINAIGVASKRAAGFGDFGLAVLIETLPALSALLEVRQLQRTARELLSTYVGPGAGERIFSGKIRRGDGEIMHAVIWYCDLRGFTGLAETEPLDKVIALLNDYFDRMAAPVVRHGGEILKFIGDSMLAIFPCDAAGGNECRAIESALSAAEEAVSSIAEMNAERRARDLAPIACGIAIHIGDVMYGNVGAADRLDFTVIGPAVNLVCRMEGICSVEDCSIVASPAIVDLSTRKFRSLGHHAFKGIAEPREVFALVERTG